LLTLAAVAGIAAIASPPSAVHACSAGGDWEPVRESDVIVGGRILGYEPLTAPVATNPMVPIWLRMRIDHVYKGAVRADEIVVDQRSLMLYTDDIAGQVGRTHDWAGASGGCGAIDHEPTGWYAVFGLRRDEQQAWLTTNRLTTFYLDPAPYDVGQLEYLNQRLGLPAAGQPARTGSRFEMAIVPMVFGLAALMCAGVIPLTREKW
jgi:hypothetical protein